LRNFRENAIRIVKTRAFLFDSSRITPGQAPATNPTKIHTRFELFEEPKEKQGQAAGARGT
jgi:hypothetical protein